MSAGKNEDPTWSLLLMVGLFGAGAWLIWYFFKIQIMEGLRYFRLAELAIFASFDEQSRACLVWLKDAPVGEGIVPSNDVFQKAVACYGASELKKLSTTEALRYYSITPLSLGHMMTLATQYMRWIGVASCAAIAIYAGFITPRNKFKTRHTIETFIKAQAAMWPVISPIVHFSPSKESARIPGDVVPDKLPIFAEALSPEEWLAWHRIPVVNGVPDKERTRRAFLLQLGPRWQGPETMPIHMQCLYAAFALQGVQKREACDVLLGKIALAWSKEHGFKPGAELVDDVRKIIRDPAVGGKANEIAQRYAYRTTVLLGLLRWARFMGGVLAPAQFLWLRAEDRNLWYPLNNLGRRSFHSEGAGAIAHYMAEEAAQKPLPIPRIDTALITINQYLANSKVRIPSREEPKKLLSAP